MTPWLALVLLTLAVALPAGAAVRDHGGYYTPERIANLRANVAEHDWAAAERDRVVKAAAAYAALSNEELWRQVLSQSVPRGISVDFDQDQRKGCPVCGGEVNKHGNYPWKVDPLGEPWKITCPVDGTKFPTNDFGAYYQSGIDETGQFNPERADRSLLYNTEHPDPNDPKHRWGVDDGLGWVDESGHRWRFVGYYAWQHWTALQAAVGRLADAWLYTGDPMYAEKTLVLLDRIADVYPSYDFMPYHKLGFYHSHGGTGKGKIQGSIWESGTARVFAEAYDATLSATADLPGLYAFLAEMDQRYDLPGDKGTREALIANIDDGLLREGAQAVRDEKIRGNAGMHQRAMAQLAIALDTEPETSAWLDWCFAPDGGKLANLIVGEMDRDGVGNEAAPGYALGWNGNIGGVADLIADYGKYTTHDIYRDFPSFANGFTAGWRILVNGFSTPNIGDSGRCGSTGKVQCRPDFMIRGYQYTGDPAIALAAWYAADGKIEGLGRDIFSADPDRIEREVAELAQAAGANPFQGGRNLAGYGLASIGYGWGEPGTAAWLYYGRSAGAHPHHDRNNIGLFFRGVDMMPEHGYPEFTGNWPHRGHVTDNTLFHNTVVVNRLRQNGNWTGHPELFSQLTDFGAVRIDSREVYDDVDQYQRTLAYVNVGDTGSQGYAFDVFRIRGGSEHQLSVFGPPGTVTTTGLNLTEQPGTLAGADVEYRTEQKVGPEYGYAWMTHLERDAAPPPAYTVDWRADPEWRSVDRRDLHLRYHGFTPVDDLTLGDAQPPQNKGGNPEWLRYALPRRVGENLTTTFVGLLEPYEGQPIITAAQRLAIADAPDGAEPVALRVELADGSVDYLVASDSDTGRVTAADGLSFAGAVGWLRVRDGKVIAAALNRGTTLSLGDFRLTAESAGQIGTIVKRDDDTEGEAYVWVDTPLPTDDTLVGHPMIIANDRVRNATYTISSVERDGELTKVSLGKTTFVRGYKDASDLTQGYVYNFEPGAGFVVPSVVEVKGEGGGYRVTSTVEAEVAGG